jgi:hypothetical protein
VPITVKELIKIYVMKILMTYIYIVDVDVFSQIFGQTLLSSSLILTELRTWGN